MDPNATNSSPADSSSAGGSDVPDEDFDTYVSRMDGGAGDTSTRAPAAQSTAQDQGQSQDDQGAAQGQGQGDQGQGQSDNGKDGQGQGDGKDRRPWKRIIAATAAARNSAAAQKVAELEAENARLRALAGGQPAQAVAAVAQAQAPGAKPRPREEDFVKPDGTFDGAAYLDARDEWRDSERERVERERSERQVQERTQAEEVAHAQKVGATFWGKVDAMTAEIPDARETLEGMASPEIASRIPPRVQIALLEADPLVTYAIAHREDLLASVMSTDVASSLRLVGHLEGLLAQYQNQQGAAAGAPTDDGQTAAGPSLMAPQAAQPARNTSGQFVAGMPATPPRPQPRAPVDLGGGGSRPANPLDGDDFEAAAEFLDRKNRRR